MFVGCFVGNQREKWDPALILAGCLEEDMLGGATAPGTDGTTVHAETAQD